MKKVLATIAASALLSVSTSILAENSGKITFINERTNNQEPLVATVYISLEAEGQCFGMSVPGHFLGTHQVTYGSGENDVCNPPNNPVRTLKVEWRIGGTYYHKPAITLNDNSYCNVRVILHNNNAANIDNPEKLVSIRHPVCTSKNSVGKEP